MICFANYGWYLFNFSQPLYAECMLQSKKQNDLLVKYKGRFANNKFILERI